MTIRKHGTGNVTGTEGQEYRDDDGDAQADATGEAANPGDTSAFYDEQGNLTGSGAAMQDRIAVQKQQMAEQAGLKPREEGYARGDLQREAAVGPGAGAPVDQRDADARADGGLEEPKERRGWSADDEGDLAEENRAGDQAE